MLPFRRTLLAAGMACLAGMSMSQSYPAKPIRIIVPFPAGGGTDIIAREISQKMAVQTGWNFVIDNKPGSGGNLGIDAVAKAAPDGYTIALGQSSNLSINPTLYTKLPYDPLKDLAPIGVVASSPVVIVVAADSPLKSLADFVSVSKAKPGSLNYASSGNGTVGNLAMELFLKQAGIKAAHIPYRGAAQAVTDLLGGQVQLFISSAPTMLGHIRAGKMRALAVTSAKRVDDIPDVPTVAEAAGLKDFEAVTWFGFVAPAGTPAAIVNRLNTEIAKTVQSADVRKKLEDQGADILKGSPEQFGALIRKDIARWAPIIKESGAKVE